MCELYQIYVRVYEILLSSNNREFERIVLTTEKPKNIL